MKTLRDYINESSKNKTAIGHFNFATAEMLRGIVEAAKEANTPVIVGLSEGERNFFGVKEARAIVSAYRDDFGIPIFLNADHTKSFERAKEAIDAGFDAIVADGSALPFAENVEMIKKIISYSRETGKNIVVEGELGFIGTSSEVLENLPPGVAVDELNMTPPYEAEKFVRETGVDMLAPSVGNVHGIIKSGNPVISIKRIEDIKLSTGGVPLVLHGASGIPDGDVAMVAKAGVVIVHFSTEIRVAFHQALISSLSENHDEISPYKYLRGGVNAVREIVKKKISLFKV